MPAQQRETLTPASEPTERQKKEEISVPVIGFHSFGLLKNTAECCISDDNTHIKSKTQLATCHAPGSWISMVENRNPSFYSYPFASVGEMKRNILKI